MPSQSYDLFGEEPIATDRRIKRKFRGDNLFDVRAVVVATHKRCPRCERTHPVSKFNSYVSKISGNRYFNTYCRVCDSSRRRKLGRTPEGKRSMQDKNLRKKFGIGADQYDSMLEAQGGVCAICGKPETNVRKSGTAFSLSVDHCHTSGAVRDLLCFGCNAGLGAFRDDPALLQAAVAYLARHRTS